jgi:hypothetical protein
MHTYRFLFKCGKCVKELTEVVTSPEVLTREELNQMQFHLSCRDAHCGWTGERTGSEAEKIIAALKPESVCG